VIGNISDLTTYRTCLVSPNSCMNSVKSSVPSMLRAVSIILKVLQRGGNCKLTMSSPSGWSLLRGRKPPHLEPHHTVAFGVLNENAVVVKVFPFRIYDLTHLLRLFVGRLYPCFPKEPVGSPRWDSTLVVHVGLSLELQSSTPLGRSPLFVSKLRILRVVT
jgi:hypothetical protein